MDDLEIGDLWTALYDDGVGVLIDGASRDYAAQKLTFEEARLLGEWLIAVAQTRCDAA